MTERRQKPARMCPSCGENSTVYRSKELPDDPITRSLKEAEDVLRKAAAGAPLAVPGAGEEGAHL